MSDDTSLKTALSRVDKALKKASLAYTGLKTVSDRFIAGINSGDPQVALALRDLDTKFLTEHARADRDDLESALTGVLTLDKKRIVYENDSPLPARHRIMKMKSSYGAQPTGFGDPCEGATIIDMTIYSAPSAVVYNPTELLSTNKPQSLTIGLNYNIINRMRTIIERPINNEPLKTAGNPLALREGDQLCRTIDGGLTFDKMSNISALAIGSEPAPNSRLDQYNEVFLHSVFGSGLVMPHFFKLDVVTRSSEKMRTRELPPHMQFAANEEVITERLKKVHTEAIKTAVQKRFKEKLAEYRKEHPDDPIDAQILQSLAIGESDNTGVASIVVVSAFAGAYDSLFTTRTNKTVRREIMLSNLISSTESATALHTKLSGGYFAFENKLLENINDEFKLAKTFKKAMDFALPFDPDTKLVEKSATLVPRLPLKVYYLRETKL